VVLRIVLAVAVLAVALLVARRIDRRRPDAPARDAYPIPRQLDRHDFPRPDAPWLVVLFSSSTCESCEPMRTKVAALESDSVATVDVEASEQKELQARYGVEGVPMVVIADHEGVVHRGFVGPMSAAELWAAVAEARG